MRRAALIAVVLAGVLASAAGASQTGTFTLRGTVTRVVDGDTLIVGLASGRSERVRLIGIDTPDTRPVECFAREATAAARRLANGRRVRLVGDRTQNTRDRYGRLLAYVVLESGRDMGRELIAGGHAAVYVYRRPFLRISGYRSAEGSAKAAKRGLWRSCRPVKTPPPPLAPPAPPPPNPLPPPPPPPSPLPPPPPPPSGTCHASYPTVCIPPPPPDLDCGQIAFRNFTVRHDVPDPDPQRFDGDRDGVGCET
jgi:micrococcal nuclease